MNSWRSLWRAGVATALLSACGSANDTAGTSSDATLAPLASESTLPPAPLTSVADLPVVDTIPPPGGGNNGAAAAPPSTLPAGTTVQLGDQARLGDNGPGVSEIQRLLSERWGYADVAATGLFDVATERGVTDFQRATGLTPNGKVDAATWTALNAENR